MRISGFGFVHTNKRYWRRLASDCFGARRARGGVYHHAVFTALFGTLPEHVVQAWECLVQRTTVPQGYTPVHFLWGLYFLKTYPSMHEGAVMVGTNRLTFAKWIKFFIKELELLGKRQLVSTRVLTEAFNEQLCI